jgi:dTDP-4-dehydrorhamnose reductase
MKILLFGKNGQVGWELQRALAPLGELIALDRAGANGLCGDLMDTAGIVKTINTVAPDVIVNAAAYTAVDKAESEPAFAELINVQAVRVMADEAFKINALFLHYSTDYVFDGQGNIPWQESDLTSPLSVYGRTKRDGEQAIIDSQCMHVILRTSWVYAARGQNFAKTMLRLAAERESLNVIDDQIGAPTGADLISDVSAHVIRSVRSNPELSPAFSGIYHLAAAGETSWLAYAQFVIEFAQQQGQPLKVAEINPIPSIQYPTPAKRPLNSRLATNRLTTTFGLSLPHWKQGVARMLNEIWEVKQ